MTSTVQYLLSAPSTHSHHDVGTEPQASMRARCSGGSHGWRKHLRRALLACLVPLVVSSGCSVLRQTHDTVRTEHLYSNSNRKIEKQMKAWAEEAWCCHCGANGLLLDDKHLAKGFEAGFIRYLKTGEATPPLMPPEEYLKAKYVSVEGRDAVNRWIRGHELGTAAAAQSGYRELVKIPVLGAIAPDDNPLPPAESVIVEAAYFPDAVPLVPVDPQPVPPSLPNDDVFSPREPTEALPGDLEPTIPSTGESDEMSSVQPVSLEPVEEVEAPATADRTPQNEFDDAFNPFATTTGADVAPSEAANDVGTPLGDSPPTGGVVIEAAVSAEDSEAAGHPWQRTRTTIPASMEVEVPTATEPEDTRWLHPPETSPAVEDEFGFPESNVPAFVFDEDSTSPEVPVPTTETTVPTAEADTDSDKAAKRRSELYVLISNSTSAQAEQIVDRTRTSLPDEDIEDVAAWPQVDEVIFWSNPE